jgi:hypothetical protein
LDVIAGQTSSLHPQSKILKDGDPIPKDAVIKRTHSDCGDHVIMPTDLGDRNWDNLNDNLHILGSVWIAQALVPTLRKLGEWKVILIGGQPLYTVSMYKIVIPELGWK